MQAPPAPVKVWLHSTGDASPPAALLLAQIRILGRRALPAGRLARLGATPDFHHGLLVPWKRDALHKARSAAPGWQGAKSELIGHK
jgi:hypothetical protein